MTSYTSPSIDRSTTNRFYTSTMQWSECSTSSGPSDAHGGMASGINPPSAIAASAPTIKNHSVTHFGRYLYCFGGYDGRRNHTTLLLYDLIYNRWIRPIHYDDSNPNKSELIVIDPPVVHHPPNEDTFLHHHHRNPMLPQDSPPHSAAAAAGNHIIVQGTPPAGRNGHSATLATEDEENGRIVIIGGWLGTGPLAASDTHVLDVACGGRVLRWYQPTIHGTPPGPCNMHSADYAGGEIYVFRGGNGREYLNDLHALNVKTWTWRKVHTTGELPQRRANHSSAMLEETHELFIFGGWNGTERLNDIHVLDTVTNTWTFPKVHGVLPHPRAGMTLTALRGRLFLFGGSGTSAKCFQDLQILDRQEMAWLDVSQHNGTTNNTTLLSANNISSSPNSPPLHREPQFLFGGGHHFSPPSSGNRSVGTHSMEGNSPSMYGYPGMESLEPPQAGGTQDGAHPPPPPPHPNHSFLFPLSDWRSRDLFTATSAAHRTLDRTHPHTSPNPNDEDTVPSVLVHGLGPGRRAGHTATAVHRRIYIFGGSCGSDYLNDFFVLDTDPPPQAVVTEPTSLQLLERRLRHFFNDEEFADVTFIVQGRKVFGHKMVLSIVSECFRAMFTTGFRESDAMEIEIPDCTYAAFIAVMEYIYTGALPNSVLDVVHNGIGGNDQPRHYRDRNLVLLVEILELADRFFLDHLRQICESKLQNAVNVETVEYLLPVAQKTNATQLLAICEHLLRNRGPRAGAPTAASLRR